MAGETILVVDDNAANLKLARVLLAGEGYDVRTAQSAMEALETLKTLAPHVILMDIQLPDIDGLELTRRIKADPTKSTIILALTAYAMKGDDEKAIAAGCDGYITKPIDTSTLPALIAKYIAENTGKRADGPGVKR